MSLEKDIRDILAYVHDNIKGRQANTEDNLFLLLKSVAHCGDGHYLEIGTLFGGSAISVALLKKQLGQKGDVYCIDPLNGYYFKMFNSRIDAESGIEVNPEIVIENCEYLGVRDRVHLITKESYPFPEELKDMKFSSCFIDGDHWGEMPWNDWLNVKGTMKIGGHVVFDNHDDEHPAIQSACERAEQDEEWSLVTKDGIVFILERTRTY